MKIAVAQTTAHSDLEENLKNIESYVVQAKAQGAELVVLPEMAYFSGKKSDWKSIVSEFSALTQRFCALAKAHSIALIPGTLREPSEDPHKFYNTLIFINADGQILTHYRKIFLYRAVLPDRNYDETEYSKPGSDIVTLNWKGICLGFAICFDLRFPEIFRVLKKRGSQIVFLPSAFTVPTGKAHWELLIRARAIENQFFMLAPGLTGVSGDGAEKYGHSLVVGPWGEVLTDLKTEEQVKTIEIDVAQIADAEKKVPAWACRREELFPIS
jgi:predicted amidohydrolase